MLVETRALTAEKGFPGLADSDTDSQVVLLEDGVIFLLEPSAVDCQTKPRPCVVGPNACMSRKRERWSGVCEVERTEMREGAKRR